jgi:hypothetical protein
VTGSKATCGTYAMRAMQEPGGIKLLSHTYELAKRATEGRKPSENQTSIFLGDPPPEPRFLASLGPLSGWMI